MRELTVEMIATVDSYGGSTNPDTSAYWGYEGPGLMDWMHRQLGEDHVAVMGATTYRQMAEVVASQADETLPRAAEIPKVIFSRTRTSTSPSPTPQVIDDLLVLLDYRVTNSF